MISCFYQEVFDLYEYLLRQRIIVVGEYINDKVTDDKFGQNHAL